MRGCLRSHGAVLAFLVVASIVAAIVYELTGGGRPRAFVTEAPALNHLNREGDKPRALWRDDDFECLGWRATHGCDPHGPRDPRRDRRCDQRLTRVSGYCEVRNRTSGRIHRVMLATCKSWQWWLVERKNLTCNDARVFTDFSLRAAAYEHPPPLALPFTRAPDPADNKPLMTSYKRGVVMIGYPKVIAGVYAIVRILRFHGCTLPVEVWIDPMEMRPTHSVLVELVKNYNVLVRTILDPTATKFFTKPYAIYNSYFESVLFLDSDNIPAQDPTYLFETPEFTKFGAMFWPDFWRPTPTTPFNVHEQSLLWQLLDMPFIDMFEQESGQLLVNRTRSMVALNKLMFYSTQLPRLLTDWYLVYGDKDLFRLAWLNTSTPFHYVPHVVALGGLYDEDDAFFCGVAMIQRDPSGAIIFMHRNQAKLNGRRDQTVVLTHLQKFTGGNGDATSLKQDLDKFRVRCSTHRLGQENCFYINAKTPDGSDTPLLIQSLANTKYPILEKQAIHFSIEGRNLLTRAEEAEISTIERKAFAKAQEEIEKSMAAKDRADRNFVLLVLLSLAAVAGLLALRIRARRRYFLRKAKHSGVAAIESVDTSNASVVMPGNDNSWRRKKSVQQQDGHIL